MRKIIIAMVVSTSSLYADPSRYVLRVAADDTILESCPTSTPTTRSVGPLQAPDERVVVIPWVDLVGHPTIRQDATALQEHVPTLRLVTTPLGGSQIRHRLKADTDTDVAKKRVWRRTEARIEARMKLDAAHKLADENPGEAEVVEALAEAQRRVDEAAARP